MLPEGNLQLLGALAHHMLHPVVPVAILPNQLHILYELLRAHVEIMQEPLLDSAEVHGVGDDGEVVSDIEPYWVDWLDEVVGAFLLGAARHDLEGDFVPSLLLHAFYLLLSDAVWIGGQLF